LGFAAVLLKALHTTILIKAAAVGYNHGEYRQAGGTIAQGLIGDR